MLSIQTRYCSRRAWVSTLNRRCPAYLGRIQTFLMPPCMLKYDVPKVGGAGFKIYILVKNDAGFTGV